MMMTVVMAPAQHRYSGTWWLCLKRDVTQQEEALVFINTELISLDDFLLFFFLVNHRRLTSPLVIEYHDHRRDTCLMVWLIGVDMTQTLFAFPKSYLCNH